MRIFVFHSFCLQHDDNPLHSVGTAAVVVQVTGTNWPSPAYTLLATGLCRFRIDDLLQESPYLVARVTQLDKMDNEKGKAVHLFYRFGSFLSLA